MTPILVHQTGPARWLRLNRPHRHNALDPALIAALETALSDAMADNRTRVVVIAAAGKSFCAGADLRHLLDLTSRGEDPLAFLARISGCFTQIERAPKPVVAALHGHVVAGGLELALACDVVVAQAGTLIGDGHVRNALLPGGGASVRLPRKVGEPLARWLVLTGELLPAEAFLPGGFIRAVASPEDFDDLVTEVVDSLDGAGEGTHARAKYLLHRWHETTAQDALDRELDVFAEHWRTADIAGALTRFVDKKARP
jgi:enoyl-CoA hydratase